MTDPANTQAFGDAGVQALAYRFRDGRCTSVQATRHFLDAIAATNARLKAFLLVDEAGALRQAEAADRRFAGGRPRGLLDGIPIALKDNIDVAGQVTTNGVGALRERRPAQTAVVAQRLLDAGAVILGKLNMHEAAFGATTDNPHFGTCQNPKVAGDTPGGSSGGSGAAVAGGLCAAALGTDTLGSVRIPAAYCGTVGLMASRGLVSRRGVCSLSPTLDQVGVLARNVGDAAWVMATIAGHDAKDSQSDLMANDWAGRLERWLANEFASDAVDGIGRVGVVAHAAACDGPDAAQVHGAIERVSQWLLARQVTVEPVNEASAYGRLRRAALLIVESEGYQQCQRWLAHDGVSQSLRDMLAYGHGKPAAQIAAARETLTDAAQGWRDLLEPFDCLLLPTAPQTSFAHGSPVPVSQADFTTPASVAGLPAVSIPVGRTRAGRMLSAQLIGPVHQECRIWSLASQIHAAHMVSSVDGDERQ